MTYVKKFVAEQPFIMAQVGAIAALLIATGLPIDLLWLDRVMTAAFAVLALVVEVWGWKNLTPLARPMDNDGNLLTPEGT